MGAQRRVVGTVIAGVFLLSGAAHAQPPAEQPHEGPVADFRHGPLQISVNRRFLVHADGSPFFWVGDTAWELFHRLNREDVEAYLEKRRSQGFTVIQAVALAEFDGLTTPNAYGHTPLVGNDPNHPDVKPGNYNDYWDHVDYVFTAAARKGLTIALLPTWADKVGPSRGGKGPVVFDAKNAAVFGQFLARRYGGRQNLVWVIGGDRPAVSLTKEGGTDYRPIWRAMATAIKKIDRQHLMTFHPWRPDSSSRWFHDDAWLDFNMLQSGHGGKDWPNYARITGDYSFFPAKPCVDGEPRYEDHPVSHEPARGRFDEYDVRQAAYWAVFAGAFGHTYGAQDVWQFYAPPSPPIGGARMPWKEAIDRAGAWDMLHLRRLMLSRPFSSRIPDPSLVLNGQGSGADHVEATRDQAGTYAFIYLPTGRTVTVDLRKITAPKVHAWWFDPRTGKSQPAGQFEPQDRPEFNHHFTPPVDYPGRGADWVLVLDDPARGYPAPGAPYSASKR